MEEGTGISLSPWRTFTVPIKEGLGTLTVPIEEWSRTLTVPIEESSGILTVHMEESFPQVLRHNMVLFLHQCLSCIVGTAQD